jgi:hypothetical protein
MNIKVCKKAHFFVFFSGLASSMFLKNKPLESLLKTNPGFATFSFSELDLRQGHASFFALSPFNKKDSIRPTTCAGADKACAAFANIIS